MKQIVGAVLVFALIFNLAGCGIGKLLGVKVGEELAENLLEQDGANVDINGDNVVIKGEDGQQVVIGGGKWPESELGKSIPKFEKGRIDSVVETDTYFMLTFNEVKQEDAKDYIEKNKPNFPLENIEMNAEETITWSGLNKDGLRLGLTHSEDWLSITLSKEDKTEE